MPGGHSGEEIPVPIPNTEVKLSNADDTAFRGGKVGSCQTFFLFKAIQGKASGREAFSVLKVRMGGSRMKLEVWGWTVTGGGNCGGIGVAAEPFRAERGMEPRKARWRGGFPLMKELYYILLFCMKIL